MHGMSRMCLLNILFYIFVCSPRCVPRRLTHLTRIHLFISSQLSLERCAVFPCTLQFLKAKRGFQVIFPQYFFFFQISYFFFQNRCCAPPFLRLSCLGCVVPCFSSPTHLHPTPFSYRYNITNTTMSGPSESSDKVVVYPPPPPPADHESSAQPYSTFMDAPATTSSSSSSSATAVATAAAPTAPPMNVIVDAEAGEGRVLTSDTPAEVSKEDSVPLVDEHVRSAAHGRGQEVQDGVQTYATVDSMPPRDEKVTICGLHSNYALNDKEGIVVGYRSDGAVLVSIASEDIACAPIHPSNLKWGVTDDQLFGKAFSPEVLQTFVNVKNKVTSFDGMTIVKVPPSKRGNHTLFGKKLDAPVRGPDDCCCRPTPWSDLSLFLVAAGVILNFAMSIVTVVACMLGIFVCFMPFGFKYSARVWRWFAHRHIDLLLGVAPPDKGVVVTYPNATIPNGAGLRYAGSCHTWQCLAYCLIGPFISFACVGVSMMCMALGCLVFCRPLFRFVTNLVWGIATFERALVCAILTHTVCEYDLYVQGQEDEDEEPQVVVLDGENMVGRTERDVADGVTYEGVQGLGAEEGTGLLDNFLKNRGRSMEEGMALEKFNGAFTRLFGRPSKLQDIQIHPPREPGRGPRHYVTIGDSLTDAERLKVIKAYKQAFSTMYVHIVDLDEQERQGGTDYSALYS